MFNNDWNTVWNTASQRNGMDGEPPMFILLLVGGLAALALGIATHTYVKGRGKQVSLRGTASHLFGMVWLLPVVAVVLLAVLPVMSNFGGSDHRQPDGHGDDADLGNPTNPISAETLEADRAEPLSAERPAWVDAGEVDDGETRLEVVQGRQFSEDREAKQDALRVAADRIRQDFEDTQNTHGDWQLSNSLVMTQAVKKTYIERIERHTEVNDFVVYRVHHQIELSPRVREAIFSTWRTQVVDGRIWILGGLLGFVTLVLGTTASYLRIDALTGGECRRRLKLASVALIAAGGLGLSLFLPLT